MHTSEQNIHLEVKFFCFVKFFSAPLEQLKKASSCFVKAMLLQQTINNLSVEGGRFLKYTMSTLVIHISYSIRYHQLHSWIGFLKSHPQALLVNAHRSLFRAMEADLMVKRSKYDKSSKWHRINRLSKKVLQDSSLVSFWLYNKNPEVRLFCCCCCCMAYDWFIRVLNKRLFYRNTFEKVKILSTEDS